MKIGILRNEDPNSTMKWELACQKAGVNHDIIDLTSSDWLEIIINGNYDFFLLRPSGMSEHFKKLYDERIYIINKVLKFNVYPSYEECYIYENKKILADYLSALKIPHAATKIFYSKKEALSFIKSTSYPIVAKTSIGASGSGVNILKNPKQAKGYVIRAFSKGIRRKYGPNKAVGSPSKWFKKAVKSPSFLFSKLKHYFKIYKNLEKGFVLFQEYIPHDFEWRSVKIGDSYFAHKKIKFGDKASGSKGIEYVNPSDEILNFTKDLCDKLNFNFMAIDFFEDGNGGYLVNELQTIFGHVQNYILSVNGKPGRYLFINNNWVFEEGDFNTNESYDLRLETAIRLFKENNK